MAFEIRQMETVYRGWTRLYVATLVDESGLSIRREIEDHGSFAAVLPYDPDRRVALLVAQARPPVIHMGGPAECLEPPSGLLDGDDPADCARREAMEEAGVRLGEMEYLGAPFSAAGCSTERGHLFLATYAQADLVGEGGGLEEEGERITVVEVSLAELWGLVARHEVVDMKTMILIQALRLRRPDLFD